MRFDNPSCAAGKSQRGRPKHAARRESGLGGMDRDPHVSCLQGDSVRHIELGEGVVRSSIYESSVRANERYGFARRQRRAA
ncbi:MAG: hypothetical protein WBD87_14375, partial [Candidatus Acidiferrales bacterium]